MPISTSTITKQVVRIPITNVHMGGDYTGVITVGSGRKTANVILDTGSSTLAVDGNFYNPSQDKGAKLTDVAQELIYAGGSWIGAVVQSDIGIGGARVPQVSAAITYFTSQNMFGKANGILGLAYKQLNQAFTLPGTTWPPRYHYNQIQQGRVTFLQPYFSQLEQAGIFANKFAFYTKRSQISYRKANPAADPLNHGLLILGGGEESTDLYDRSKPLKKVRVLADNWYNTNLKAVIVGDSDPIHVLPPTKGSRELTNSIVDSGTNHIILAQDLFNTVIERFSIGNNRAFVHAMRAGYLPMSSLNRKRWPKVVFVLEGVSGDVRLVVTPQNYWQVNFPERGYASAGLVGAGSSTKIPWQSILGLPLLNGYLTIFDRSENRFGVITFAARQ